MGIEDKIRNLLESEINNAGYILDEVIYEEFEGNNYLRLIIDKSGIVNVDDCVVVSNIVNPILDAADPIDDRYILDVCSKEKGND